MRNVFRQVAKFVVGLFILALALISTNLGGSGILPGISLAEAKVTPETALANQADRLFDRSDPQVKAVMAAQTRHSARLLAEPGVVGTATGLSDHGRPAMMVFAKSFAAAKGAVIPAALDGVPVIVRITGEIKALKGRPAGKGGKVKVDPTARFDRPVPIGVSTGHPAITAGTIGARVTDGSNVYALSNNHIYADENNALIGDHVLQPGTYDGGSDPDDAIGDLFAFEPIVFSETADNLIDAAIALSSTAELGSATPANGYGTPKAATTQARINQQVMKYGRTTAQTKGKVYAINATVKVGYDSGVAQFVKQIVIIPGNFSAGGDSGSLIVARKGEEARMPVGLLFAGSQTITIANPIDEVLNAFGMTIDGE